MTVIGGRKHDATGRETGRRKERKNTGIGGQFSPRLVEMQRSPAYRVLSLSAHRVMDRIEIEFGDHGGCDNGKLPVTFQDFEEYGVHRHGIGPAIRELEYLGFIEITQRGRSGNGEYRKPNLFRLTYRAAQPAAPTNEWRKIETIEQANEIADNARQARSKKPTVSIRLIAICKEDIESGAENAPKQLPRSGAENAPRISVFGAENASRFGAETGTGK
jgi:hypothetical protein